MTEWGFVFAAYGLVGLATLGLTAWSYIGMRSAEADAEAAKRRP